jgi:hypothetical protein
MVRLAVELKDATVAWLQKFHPELLKSGDGLRAFTTELEPSQPDDRMQLSQHN